MSLAQRFERRLEGLVGGAFARVFKGQVEPVEVGNALQREAADKRQVVGSGQVMCPNRYRVTLGPSDHERLAPWEVQLTGSLAELVQDYLDENRWTTVGDVEVYLARDDALHTGIFGVASRMEPQAPPRRRPFDSLSMPAEPHAAPPAHTPPAHTPPAHTPPTHTPPPERPQPEVRPPLPRRGSAMVVVDQTNQRHELRLGSNVIGRGSDADLQLLDQGISRRHVDIQYDGTYATVYDLGSTNGTAVNGHEVGSQVLRHGDVIRIGHSRIVFHQDAQ